MPHSVITSKGRITIPKTVRNKLNLKTGDKIDFKIKDGEVILVPVSRSVSEVFGILSKENQKVFTVEQINDSIKKRIKKHNI